MTSGDEQHLLYNSSCELEFVSNRLKGCSRVHVCNNLAGKV